VLHHAESAEVRQLGFEVDEGPTVLLEEAVQQESPRRVGERLEHQIVIRVLVAHAGKIRD
jgi:hypothetical protein